MTPKPQANKTIDEALDEIEKLFELGETAKACNIIQTLITEARIDEQTNTGGDLDGSVYFRTKKGWSSQEDRLAELKKRGSDE